MADITATNTLTTTAASDSEALAQTAMPPVASDADAKPATGQRDTTETVTDDGVPTKDGGTVFGRLTAKVTHGARLGADKAWELTASAQRRVNEQAKQTRAQQPEPKPEPERGADEPEPKRGEEHGHDIFAKAYHTMEKAAHRAHQANVAQSIVRNYGAIRGAGTDYKKALEIVHHGELGGEVGGAVMKSMGTAFFVFDTGLNGLKVLDDITDADGLSIDSLQPIADTAASAIGTFGGPVGTAFKVGYEIGKKLDEFCKVGAKIDRAHERSIERHTQIGFLEDRAREMDLAAAARIQTGTHTRRDAMRVRSIVREAREHGILDANGNVNRGRLWSMVSSGDLEDAHRIADGIERAAALEHHSNGAAW